MKLHQEMRRHFDVERFGEMRGLEPRGYAADARDIDLDDATGAGCQILAVGGNPRAATLSGIPVNRIVVIVHTLSGLLAAIAAILLMARLGSAQPSIGSDWLLPSFAIPIVGGVALTGGSASILNTVLATFLIALIDNGLVLVKADPYWIQFLLGTIILGAVGLNRLRLKANKEQAS